MIYNPFNLQGKTILVTGASSGIGRTTAIECSRLGAKLIITARNRDRLNETLSKMEGDVHMAIVADLTISEGVNELVKDLPKLDGFVCNAGINKRSPIGFIKEDELREVFETNTFSYFMLTKSLIKAKKLNREASLVFTTSTSARISLPANSMYAASKAAIESFSRSCAIELAGKGIRSNAIMPGMVETPLIGGNMITEEERLKDEAKYLLKRYGKPEEIAWAIIYLLSDASKWITNTTLDISGGGRVN